MPAQPSPTPSGGDRTSEAAGELELLKALGDNTRYAIHVELARCGRPLTTAEVAEALGLHPNTVRPHLERLRDVGLLHLTTEHRGGVGRPQHRYALSPDAPALGLTPSPWPTLARALLDAASAAGLDADALHAAGVAQGIDDARRHGACDTTDALTTEQSRMGFDPKVSTDGDATTVVFTNCPFRQLAESQPELVCGLHCGMVEGFVTELGGQRVTDFHPLADQTPCRVELVST